MKKILLIKLILFNYAISGFAQNLGGPDTLKKDSLLKFPKAKESNYTVKDFIRIEHPGNVNEQAIQLDEQSSLLTTVTEYDAGRTAGNLNVSASGAATYNLPISLPPGINGVVPHIALSYNSQGGNGVAGFGWNINGVSTISRIPRTKFYDGVVAGVNVDMDDRYALDGQRLILKSGTYGGNNAEYQTENYSNLKIVSKGIGTNGPDYFQVYYPDGSYAFFGLNGAKTATEYPIAYSENQQGIRISYSYYISNNELLLSQINYGAKGLNTSINQISFIYKDRARNEQGYVGGQNFFRSRILSEINVVGNGAPYRNYVLTHSPIILMGYDRLTSVQEYDGSALRAFAPVYFNYDNNISVITASTNLNLQSQDINANSSGMVAGDFNGNGKMDVIVRSFATQNKVWLFVDPKSSSPDAAQGVELFPGTFEEVLTINSSLSQDNKILPGESFVFIGGSSTSTVNFKLYGVDGITPNLLYTRSWTNAPISPGYTNTCTTPSSSVAGIKIPRIFLSGDFNGDGLGDVVAISRPYTYPTNCTGGTASVTTSTVHFINLDRRMTSGFVNQAGNLSTGAGVNDKVYAADVNGDGKTDIIHITNGWMYVYQIDASNNLSLIISSNDTRITTNYPAMLGDYNGDGKMDVMFPTSAVAPNNALFALFLSRGTTFIKIEQTYPFAYTTNSTSGSNVTENNLIANDINRDGKTDIIKATTVTSAPYSLNANASVTFFSNMGTASAGGAPLYNSGTTNSQSGLFLAPSPLPIFSSINNVNFDRQFAFASGNSMHFFNFKKDFNEESRIKQVYQDGIAQYISYQPLLTTSLLPGSVYSASNLPAYPYIGMDQSPDFEVVSKIRREFNSDSLIRVFKYKNAVSHMEGLGFLGFGETIKSNWITSESDANKVYDLTITDPLLRGAPIRSFTTKNPLINVAIKDMPGLPADVVLQNAIPGAQTTEAGNSITLSDGFSASGSNGTFVAKITNPATGMNDGASITDYITRTDYTYKTDLLPSKVYINSPLSSTIKDLLAGTNTVTTYAYDSYYNITKQFTNLSGAGTTTTEFTYENNPGNGYVGRPLIKKEVATSNGDSFSTEEQYTYTGFLPTQIKRKGNGTPFITENLVYDTYGNVTSRTLVTADGSRTTATQYDGTGRFVTKQIDIEGLETTYTYNNSTGTASTVTDAYGRSTTYLYDSWGRKWQETDYLGVSSYTSYARSNSGYGYDMIIHENDDESRDKTTVINPLGNTLTVDAKDVLGQTVSKAYQYDIYGRQIKESEPGIGSINQWNQTEYDEYGRVKKLTAYTGQITNISYNGLATTVNDGTKSVTTTSNALGNVVSTQDPGGTINNTYFANGNLKSANYDGSVQTVEQDGWGRKTKLTDPSAGVYAYTYNEFGEPLTETTPKGTTTYTYNSTGKLTNKQISGDATNMGYTYAYDATTKLLTGTTLTNTDGNAATYTYTYDSNKRLESLVEDNAFAKFSKTLTYDSYGRIATEASEAKNKGNNYLRTKTILNVYQNGGLKEIKDNANGQSIWALSALNARGQVTTALLGANLKQTNVYNTYGFPQEFKTEKISGTPVTLMTLGYSFNAARGILDSRSNTAFDPTWNESFVHDNRDRLTDFNDNNGARSQSYDVRGRINNNSRLGNYFYEGNSYKQDQLTNLTAFASYHYQQNPLQTATFNGFKQPVSIAEQGKDKLSFQYNSSLQRAHMYWGSEDATKENRPFRRHYSEDGSMEITEDLPGAKTSFVFYLGGDAYSAPAIFKDVVTSTTSTPATYYLHRDHLGSITMITDDAGLIKEKRQFDAWGNIVKLTDAAGNNLTTFPILDRGYTGHEHLLSVGLVNMNGRLYDPLLHRFFSPDNYVQDPGNTQNYNRYGYVYNSPLRYTDPSGELIRYNYLNGSTVHKNDGGVGGGDGFQTWSDVFRTINRLNRSSHGGIATGPYDIEFYVPNPDFNREISHVGNVTKYDADRFILNKAPRSKSVGQPGVGETLIPVWGSGRAAVDHFQNGNYWRGAGYTVLAVSDVFLVKAAATAVIRGTVTLAGKYVVKQAVKNPILTVNEARAMVNVPKISAMMQGKGIDRAFRVNAARNLILNPAEKLGLIKLNPMNRGADIIGKGMLNGSWWDVTTRSAWGAHEVKYGINGTGLFY